MNTDQNTTSTEKLQPVAPARRRWQPPVLTVETAKGTAGGGGGGGGGKSTGPEGSTTGIGS
jgi:hypothetical protein